MLRKALTLLLSTTLLIPVLSNTSAMANELNISGSTSEARLMDVLAEDYNKMHPDTYVAVQGVGSTAGITLLKKGVIELAMTSRYLTEEEMEPDLVIQLLAYDGITVVVNLLNPVANITRDQLYSIYKGNITNWKELGGPDRKIAVVTREASSGTRFSFESLIGLTRVINDRLVSDINPNNLVVNSNGMVKTLVNHNPQAIGFISAGSADLSTKALNFEGVEANAKNVLNGSYELSRPFLVLHYSKDESKEIKQFIEYLKSDHARSLILSSGYIPSLKE